MGDKLHQVKYYIRHFFTAKRRGHGVHSPFAYRLCEEVFYNRATFYDFERLERLREDLLKDKTMIRFEEHGAGSKTLKGGERMVKHIAASGISRAFQSQILYRLLNFLNCKSGIELGTSLGLNSLYLAAVNQNIAVVSVDACQDLCEYAQKLAAQCGYKNIRFVNSLFDRALPALLPEASQPFFVYVDGNHTYEATLLYFKEILKHADSHSVIVFDDIYWSPGMTKAWEEIKNHPSVKMSIDLYYMGIVFFREEILEPVSLKFFI